MKKKCIINESVTWKSTEKCFALNHQVERLYLIYMHDTEASQISSHSSRFLLLTRPHISIQSLSHCTLMFSHTFSLASFHSHHFATHFHLLLRKWCGFIKKSICLPLKSSLNPFRIDKGIQSFSNRLFYKPREFYYMWNRKEKKKRQPFPPQSYLHPNKIIDKNILIKCIKER